MTGSRCPCRGDRDARHYADCCEPYHAGRALPPSAEALMRSRFSAFARRDAAYLLATWHASTRPTALSMTIGEQWLSLAIETAHEVRDDATVTFLARCRRDGRVHTLHEISRFRREFGRWFYIDGIIL